MSCLSGFEASPAKSRHRAEMPQLGDTDLAVNSANGGGPWAESALTCLKMLRRDPSVTVSST